MNCKVVEEKKTEKEKSDGTKEHRWMYKAKPVADDSDVEYVKIKAYENKYDVDDVISVAIDTKQSRLGE